VWDVEIEKNLENNPVVRRRWELECELQANGFSIQPLAYPAFQPGDIEGFKNILLHGDKVTYPTPDLGEVSGEIWLPNFNIVGFSGWGITEDIAALIALDKIARMRK
jgi:hypothetical protein